jgi:hypothetical protein
VKRLVFALLLIAACSRDKELAGVGKWNVRHTRLKDAEGRCTPQKLADGRDGAYCFGNQPIGIKGMAVDFDLYFASMDPEATLVEIQMKIGGCRSEDLEAWMRTNFGAPYETTGTRAAWKNQYLFAAGYLPLADEPGRCLVRIIPATEPARFEQIWSGSTGQ